MLNIFRRRSFFISERASEAVKVFKCAVGYFSVGNGKKHGELAMLVDKFTVGRAEYEKAADKLGTARLKASCLRFFSGLEFSLGQLKSAAGDLEYSGYSPDDFMVEMVSALYLGAVEIRKASSSRGKKAEESLLGGKRACVALERVYRRALAALRSDGPQSVRSLKRESVYKALGEAGDRLDCCADALAELCQ